MAGDEQPVICLCAQDMDALHPVWALRGSLGIALHGVLLCDPPRKELSVTEPVTNDDGVIRIERSGSWRGRAVGRLRALLRELRPDAVHLLSRLPEVVTACRQERIALLYSPARDTGLFDRGGFLAGRWERKLARFARGIVVESDLQQERLLDLGYADDRCVVVLPGWVRAVPEHDRRPGVLGSLRLEESAPEPKACRSTAPGFRCGTGEDFGSIAGRSGRGGSERHGGAFAEDAAAGAVSDGGRCGGSDADESGFRLRMEQWQERRAGLLRDLGLAQEVRYAGLVWPSDARLQQRYLEMASRLCRLVKGLHLLVAGTGEIPPALRRMAQRDLAGVLHLQAQPREEAFFLPLDCFIHCGKSWGTPPPVLQAMAYGVPVVAEECPGLQAAITTGETGVLVPGGGWAAVATAAATLLNDDALAARLGAWGCMSARERYAPAQASGALRRLYECVRQEPGGQLADRFYGAPAGGGGA